MSAWRVMSVMGMGGSPKLCGTHLRQAGGRYSHQGQALTEFLVALVMFVPMVWGMFYAGRYADLQLSAIQASRYAAFQRAMQPDEGRLATAAIQEAMRARFFLRGDRRPDNPLGELRSTDGASGYADGSQVVLWRDLAGRSLLPGLQDVTLSMASQSPSLMVQAHDRAAQAMFRAVVPQRVQVAHVELALIDHWRGLASGPLRVGATTAISGDAANAKGSQGVRDTLMSHGVVAGSQLILRTFDNVLAAPAGLLESHPPELGCLRLEAVPVDRLSGDSASGTCQ